MENRGPRFTISSTGAKKRTLIPPKDITGKRITRTQLIVHYKDTQSQSQELELEEVDTEYKKPVRVDTGICKITNTEDNNNEWASPSIMIWRHEESEDPKKHIQCQWQVNLKKMFLPTINKPVTASLEEADWPRLIQWIKAGGPKGQVVKPETTTMVKSGPNKGQTKKNHEISIRLYAPARPARMTPVPCYHFALDKDRCYPLCNEPNCLAIDGVTFKGLKCNPHYGDRKYAAVEVAHTFNGVSSALAVCFKFTFEKGSNVERMNQRFKSMLNNTIQRTESPWKAYTDRLKTQGVKQVNYTINKEIFDRPEDAENCLAMWETARLFAKLNDSNWKGKAIENLNPSIVLAYKNEEDMAEYLREEYSTTLSCHPVLPGNYDSPAELGRVASPGSHPTAEELTIYMQGNAQVVYSGKQDTLRCAIASKKVENSVLKRYLKSGGLPLTDYALLYCNKDKYHETEELVNLCNYIGHLFKLKNKFTEDDYVCLNKEIRKDFLEGRWGVVQAFCRYFFGMEISMTNA